MAAVTQSSTTTNNSESNFLVVSWNVLHIIHELNNAVDTSPVIARYSIHNQYANEQQRLNDIVLILQQIFMDHLTIESFICLQEVPGDLIPKLQTMLDSVTKVSSLSTAMIYKQMYPRQPRVRRERKECLYMDSNEFLVTIHYQPNNQCPSNSNTQMFWVPCPVDGGKGALGLTTVNGLTVINIHVPYDNQAATALLSHLSWPINDSRFVLVGDMNRGSSSLMKIIQTITQNPIQSVTTEQPTRVGVNSRGIREKSSIDYFLLSPSLHRSVVSSVKVFDDIGDISDHYPILLQFNEKKT